ncbi:MAG TPA: lytic murein transglycosylase B [Burkholderiales bacterium]|nr:lytic murein transglycosylase B [Burkholderiales bacterium]
MPLRVKYRKMLEPLARFKKATAADDIRLIFGCDATQTRHGLFPHFEILDRLAMASASRGKRDARLLGQLLLAAALPVLLVSPHSVSAQSTPAQSDTLKPEVRRFIAHMVRNHGFDGQALRALLANAQPNQDVLRAISVPVTSRPWYQFRPLCVDDAQIADGVRFWNDNAASLERARRDFGVPQEIVVAVIGVESRYGRHAGGFRAIDALYTLAFEWPNRAEYFRGELEQFLVLAREQRWDTAFVQGSFAGALGWPQFMPSNYRRFAVDYSGDGSIDLWGDMADIVGSVASYLQQFGWKAGQPIAAPAQLDGVDPGPLLQLGFKPQLTWSQWQKRGLRSPEDIDGQLPASLFSVDLADGPEYWLGFDNFHALLRYNHSRNYAMAVYQLAQQIRAERERQGLTGSQ